MLSDENPDQIRSILIPKVQRAYAQGRGDAHATKTRERFLQSIYDSILGNAPLTLDFIYGHVDDKGCLIPLDGQQRLTTLWLLHWYAAKRGGVDTDILGKFSYDTRYSARDFIKRMVQYTPTWEGKISESIRNEGWFPLEWGSEPTVSGMFVMIDAIHELFSGIDDLWSKLDLINFYFLGLQELQLTDEIYIKMNSRGKPLTDFEHFKAELLKVLKAIPVDGSSESGEDISKRIGHKIDIEWTDLLWDYRDKNNLIDDQFLRAFRIVCHLLTYRDDRSYNDETSKLDDFELIKVFFSGDDARRNVAFLEAFFDSWIEINKSTPQREHANGIEAFFAQFLSLEHEPGKTIPLGDNVDLLRAGLQYYPDFRNPNVRQWLTSFYAFLTYIQNRDKITEEDFRRRLRIIVNLQANSDNEVVDSPKGDAGNRMPAILLQVRKILFDGVVEKNIVVDGKERPTFNVAQLTEEAEKLVFTQENPEQAEPLFALEDHELLDGKTLAVGYQNTHLYKKFEELFAQCSRDAIDCAMLAVADYSQRQGTIMQLGSGDEDNAGDSAWYSLFHPSVKVKGFDSTATALRTVLERFEEFSDEALYAFAEEYERKCEEESRYDWRYYYLHYPSFRAQRYGKYTQNADAPYELVAIYAPQRVSNRAYQCFLKELEEQGAGQVEEYVWWLVYEDGYLVCKNDSFEYYESDGETLIDTLEIPQEDGIDTVDRIKHFMENRL